MRRSSVAVSWMVGLSAAVIATVSLSARGQQSSAASDSAASPAASQRAVINQYCVACHNGRLKTAGLALDNLDTSNVPAGAEVWEKVIRKLRSGSMPPPGRPRPSPAEYAAVSSALESAIDRDAAARPNPGRTETVHRLNRAEYHNAIRDLLALDIDVASLLPADDMSYGFDNIAGVLKITPSLLDRYMTAARQIRPAIMPLASVVMSTFLLT